jgi:hypothetical protein
MAWMAKAAAVSVPITALLNDKTRFSCKSAPTALLTNRWTREAGIGDVFIAPQHDPQIQILQRFSKKK